MTVQLILASASPRRKQLLNQIGISHKIHAVNIDETPRPAEAPTTYVQRLAAEKSAACLAELGDSIPILAADTTVVINDQILGKPEDRVAALAMLEALSGNTHQVLTALSLRGKQHDQALSITQVTFKPLSRAEIIAYWETGEPLDKAGSYAIQGLGAAFVSAIQGSFSGVVGLPLFETAELLSRQGIAFCYE